MRDFERAAILEHGNAALEIVCHANVEDRGGGVGKDVDVVAMLAHGGKRLCNTDVFSLSSRTRSGISRSNAALFERSRLGGRYDTHEPTYQPAMGAAESSAASTASRVRRGWASTICSMDSPAARSSTVMRVPATTGLPIIALGSVE